MNDTIDSISKNRSVTVIEKSDSKRNETAVTKQNEYYQHFSDTKKS